MHSSPPGGATAAVPHPKPIETRYKGYRFRSRLEARWAVYFDTLGVDWVYENEGYDLGDGIYYLPDFWLSTVNMWAEVKPEPPSDAEMNKCLRLESQTMHECLMLVGVPDIIPYSTAGGNIYILSNHHNYPQKERRFYGCPASNNIREELGDDTFDEVLNAVAAALGHRFSERKGAVE